jgi:hypothetical protein
MPPADPVSAKTNGDSPVGGAATHGSTQRTRAGANAHVMNEANEEAARP